MAEVPTIAPTVTPGCPVTLHLEIRLPDGFVAFTSFDADPIRYTLGDGTLAPGLESVLVGLSQGSDETVLASGSDLFGPHDPDLVRWLDDRDFPDGPALEPGQLVAFATPAGHETGGLVLERDGERVRVDLNHPLAGRGLRIRVRVLSAG